MIRPGRPSPTITAATDLGLPVRQPRTTSHVIQTPRRRKAVPDKEAHAWLQARAAVLVARISDRGMVLSHDAARTLLAERHAAVSRKLGVSEQSAQHLLDDSAIDTLAGEIVGTFTDEEPGEDLFTLARTAHISVSVFGRLVSGLAEALLFYQTSTTTSTAERDARQRETAQLLSIAGMVQAEHTQGPIAAPPPLFTRIARTLTTVADFTDNEALAQALRRDATRARSAAAAAPAPD